MAKVSERIKTAMALRGKKQTDVAKFCGVSRSTVSQWCQDQYEPKRDKIESMSKLFGVREAWLKGYDVTMDLEESPLDHFNDMFKSLDYIDKGIIIGQMMNMLAQDKYKSKES